MSKVKLLRSYTRNVAPHLCNRMYISQGVQIPSAVKTIISVYVNHMIRSPKELPIHWTGSIGYRLKLIVIPANALGHAIHMRYAVTVAQISAYWSTLRLLYLTAVNRILRFPIVSVSLFIDIEQSTVSFKITHSVNFITDYDFGSIRADFLNDAIKNTVVWKGHIRHGFALYGSIAQTPFWLNKLFLQGLDLIISKSVYALNFVKLQSIVIALQNRLSYGSLLNPGQNASAVISEISHTVRWCW